MKRVLLTGCILIVCLGFVVSCSDDDDDNDLTGAIATEDPSIGYMLNSTEYRLLIDLNEQEKFDIALDPGTIIEMKLKTRKTHVAHVIVMNSANRAIGEYVDTFYINEIPLDHRFKDFICSWYLEFTPNYPLQGRANLSGS